MSQPHQEDEGFGDLEEAYTFDMISAAEEEEGVDVVEAGGYEWYVKAEEDLRKYMEGLEEVEVESDAQPASFVEDVGDDDEGLLEKNRTTSYGGWEDDALDDWGVEAITGRKRFKGETFYRVKWCSHDEETWEVEEDLIEEGHEPLINEYRGRVNVVSPKKRVRKVVGCFDPVKFWPDYATRIGNAFTAANFSATTIYPICSPTRGGPFAQLMDSVHVPVMLFHGTRGCFIDKIKTGGLKVPGTGGVKIVNGSSYGVGIYTGLTPMMSHYYAYGTGYMFVCAGLVSGKFTTSVRQPGNMVVFFRNELVIPCFLVKYATYRSDVPSTIAPPTELPDFSEMYPFIPEGRDAVPGRASATMPSNWKEKTAIFSGKMTKRELRAAPRAAKEAYRNGELMQKKSRK